ncbi:MAG: MMPL family transporter [Paludibacteraceae bacterium]|nr:MMPL family transporter [Paludibacteraceae bacterium]
MKRQFHYIFFACTIALTVICGILMTRVNVNADMTKYLPDDSQMKYGLDIVTNEFGASAQMVGADVHIMFDSISPAEIEGMCALLAAYPDVDKVAYRYSADSAHTVFDLTVAKKVNQKALGKQISNRFGGNCVVETSQDGATPPMSVMVIAAVLIMLVLFLMAQSWFEPVVILISTGVAIVLNMGTNALLPSVSITTNFIGSMLQAVLSLDYCIILLNRYRQEQNEHTDRVTAGIAVNKAVKASSSSILSSALTTVVGLLMLCFMRLKIGADMGIVLAKGVVCSLICTFTVMPSLMLLFRRVINKTQKRVFVPNTAGLARFVTSHKVSMAIGAVLLFFGSWYFSRQTTIFFSAEAESQIERIFPAPNPIVLVYDTQDERALVPLVDSLVQDSNVQMVLSYPTLLSHPRTPEQTIKHIQSLIPLMASQMPASATTQAAPFLQPSAMDEMGSMVNMLYFMRVNHGLETTMTFPDLARFLHTHCVNNPLMASFIDDDMRQQVELLQSMLLTEETPDTPLDSELSTFDSEHSTLDSKHSTLDSKHSTLDSELSTLDSELSTLGSQEASPLNNPPLTTPPAIIPSTPLDAQLVAFDSSKVKVPDQIEVTLPSQVGVISFIERLNRMHTSALTIEMQKLTDTAAIRLPMSINEMAFFIGSTPTQTRLVYGYAPGRKKLSPLEYVHLLTDDLFKRPGLQGLISPEQRILLSNRARLMDLANVNASLSPAELNQLLQAFGITGFTDDQLLAMLAEPVSPALDTLHITPSTLHNTPSPSGEGRGEASLNTNSLNTNSLNANSLNDNSLNDTSNIIHPTSNIAHPSRADLQAELFTELAFGGKHYTPAQMASKLSRLMKLSGVKSAPITAEQMSLLYTYYESVQHPCDSMRVGLDQLIAYVCDTLIADPRIAPMLPDSIRTQVKDVQNQLASGMGQLRKENHSLCVILTSLPPESKQTTAFVNSLSAQADAALAHDYYMLGESVMYVEMQAGFNHEMNVVTLFTILVIFLIVAITFRSVIVPTILVATVMTAVYVNVVVSGLVSGQMLYLAYLIVQAILMGATIDYGILFANYYRENRRTMTRRDAAAAAYKGSIRTILTSGLIMVIAPGVMAALIDDVMISNIVSCLAVGAFMAIVLILTVVPAVLVALDRLVVYGKKNRFSAPAQSAEKESVSLPTETTTPTAEE